MPAPGDQHQAWVNPFEEAKPKVSVWTAQEIATISSRLDKQLGPEYISARSGPGGQRVHYLTAEKVITLANEVFGFNGWSSSIQNIQVDFADENPQTQRVSIGLSVIVRITLKDGTYHEDIGYGSIENAKGKAMAFEKAKKEGTTDGMKRALRNFGSVLGNCIYDKDFVSQVVKLKAQPVKKFDQNSLHRHSDFVKKDEVQGQAIKPAPVPAANPVAKLEPAESFEDFLGELDEADFCVPEDGHPDEVMLPGPVTGQDGQSRSPANMAQPNQVNRAPSVMPNARPPQTPNQAAPQRPGPPTAGPAHAQGRPPAALQARGSYNQSNQTSGAAPAPPPQGEPVAFFSAKAVSQLPESSFQGEGGPQLGVPHVQQLFNPKAESPSIRKTPGIDHSSSKPLARNGQHVSPNPSSQSQTTQGAGGFAPVRPSGNGPAGARGNMTHPNLDHTRRIGAPGSLGSPLGNRNSFRQPTMKRPPPGDANGANGPRPALADLPANTIAKVDVVGADGSDTKRQKMA